MGKKVIWTNHAIADLNEAFLDFLEECESIDITDRIFAEIYNSTGILETNPEIYKLDSLKINNDNGMVRSYEKHTHRISYLVEKEKVFIIRVRYARKEPLEY